MFRLPCPRFLQRLRATTGLRRRRSRLSWYALVALAAVAVAGSAGAGGLGPSAAVGATAASDTAVSTFPADADARVHEASSTTNYGSSSTLRVDGASDPDVESYLRFTVSGITGSVLRATLRLSATSSTADGPTVSGTSNEWTESGITWANRPAPTTAAVDDKGAIATGGWAELNVTSLVSADGTFSFVVAPTSSDGADFHSRDSSSTSLRPELVIEALTSGAPVATSPPTISGVPQEGATLTASSGTWNGSQPIALAYQWQRCDSSGTGCTDIASATEPTHALTQSDVGATFRIVVTATNADGSATATSAPSGVVIGAGDVVIAAAGDIAGCGSNADEPTAQLLDSIAPTRVLTLGDNVYPDGTDAEFTGCYHPTWGRHKAITYPAPGNHDYNTPGASGYFNYFGAAADDPAKGYYAFDLGAWRLYSLNSNCGDVACSAGSDQEQWLRADLAAHSNACTLAYWHHARFSSSSVHGSNSSTAALWQALYDARADVVLVGHDHDYERFTRLNPTGAIDLERGIREFVVGTGGAGLYAFGTPITGSEVRSMTHGVLKLTLREGGYDWAFVPVSDATFTDTGTDTCGAAPADTTPPSAPTGLVSTAAVAANVGLSWTAATDDVGVLAYDVYRDALLLGSTAATSYTDTSAAAGATYAYHVTARDAARNVSGPSNTVTVTVNPTNQAPSVNAGPDQTVTLPASATLDGTVTDDGLPNPPGAVTTTWSQVGGPGTVTFGNASAIDTSAGFSTAGSYVLRLTANDGALPAFDELTVTVNPANQASPAVFAAEADARVAEAKPGSNYGSSSSLRTDGGSDPDVESYLRFSVSGVSGSVQRAIVRIYATTGTVDGPAAYGTGNGWTETGITWSTRPARTTAGIGDKGAIVTDTWVEYDVTSLVSGNGTFSFVLATTSTDGVDFHSRNSSRTTLRPQLVVTFG